MHTVSARQGVSTAYVHCTRTYALRTCV